MPFEVRWLVPGRVLLQRMYGDIDTEAIAGAARATEAYEAEARPPMHVVSDLTGIGKAPINLRQISSLSGKDERGIYGWYVVITTNPVHRFIATAVIQMARVRVRIFGTSAEALTFLRDQDPTLPKVIYDERGVS